MTEFFGNDEINSSMGFEFLNLRDPTIPIFINQDITTTKPKMSRLRHHKNAFIGCFSCVMKKNINYNEFNQWKNNPEEQGTKKIAHLIIRYIKNYYDFLTTAPPSKHRDINNYCCFELCKYISAKTRIPFLISFEQRKNKSRHGRYASLEAEVPVLVSGWNYKRKSILFVDDFITTGRTAKQCYNILYSYNNHVDGLIYCSY